MSVSKQSAFSTANKQQKLFPCAICKKLTEQTCSLCRKVFYCSGEHQQIDWHMKHKAQCEGKIMQYNVRSQSSGFDIGNQFQTGESVKGRIFPQQNPAAQIQQRSVQVRMENQSREWMKLFEQRLIMRRKCLDSYQKLYANMTKDPTTTNKPPQAHQLHQLQQSLLQLSTLSNTLLQSFKPPFTPILQQSFGMTTNIFILQLDYLLDQVLLNKFHSLIHKHEEVRKFLMGIEQLLPVYGNDNDARFRDVYEGCLKGMLELSEQYCNDKVSEKLMSKYVMIIQRFDGIMQRVYTYMNMGSWYMSKTYYHKAIKCYSHSLQLLQSHLHNSKQQQQSSTSSSLSSPTLLIKSNLLFNQSLCQHELNQVQQSYQSMQQAYRLRVRTLGKNAIECSHCLYTLAQWTLTNNQYQDTLHYAKQCYRIRKLNKDNYPQHLIAIEKLLQQIYYQLKTEREKNVHQMNTQNVKYYDAIMMMGNGSHHNSQQQQQQQQREQRTLQTQESFIKQLNTSLKPQLVKFKLIITPEMAQTYSSRQWQKLTQCLQLYEPDQLITKDEMRRIIFENDFTESLNQQQRDAFVKANFIQ